MSNGNGNGSLTKLTEATRMLAEIRTVDDAKKIINLAEAARVYAREIELGLEAQNHAAEIKLRAQRQAGKILADVATNQGTRTDLTSSHPVTKSDILEESGIDKMQASRWQQIAELPQAKFEAVIAATKSAGKELTTADVLRAAKDDRRERDREAQSAANKDTSTPNGVKLIIGDFRTEMASIPDNSVDLIFTDPPYDRESISLYGDLAREAQRVLKPGGSLLAYVGHYAVGEVFNLMSPHLRYWWMIAVRHGGNSARLTGVNVFVEWKPVMWFVKEKRGGNREFVADLVESTPPTKNEHDWQQSATEALYYIDKLTEVGGTVLDPFAGSGTTLIAALSLGRNSIGIELDTERAQVARGRINAATR